jgi:prepilin-type N-terminal cleavage/methylation domain-containing protein
MKRASNERRQQGFTLIEVMVSLGVMMIGTMAVLALQQHTIRSTKHARQLSTAVSIAERWQSRLEQDAHHLQLIDLTDANAPQNANEVAAAATYLQVVNDMPNGTNLFQPLPTDFTNTGISRTFDHNGDDIAENSTDVAFCASFRPGWIWTPSTAPNEAGAVMRTDVRVWWPREGVQCQALDPPDYPDIASDFGVEGCIDDDTKLSPGGDLYDCYHVLYLPGVVRISEVR